MKNCFFLSVKSTIIGNSNADLIQFPIAAAGQSDEKGHRVNDISLGNMDLDELAKKTSLHLENSGNYSKIQNITLILLILCMGMQGAFERGLLSYITTYCYEYLEINDKYGRYFQICFYAGSVGGRVVRQIFCANSSPVYQVFVGWLLRLVLCVLFIFYGNGIAVLYVLYILMGILSGGAIPGLCSWGELIKPTTGFIACMWWVSYGTGDAIMSFTMGGLIQKYGSFLMPIIILFPLLFGVILNIIAVLMFTISKKKENSAIREQIQENNNDEK